MWTAKVIEDPGFMAISIALSRPSGTGYMEVVFLTMGEPRIVPEGARSDSGERVPTLPDHIGLTVLDALIKFYRGTDDTRQLREDYEHERRRVDKFIDTFVSHISDRHEPPRIVR
jgi:hypothetical protein